MNAIADHLVTLVICAGIPAVVGMLWRVGSKVERLGVTLTHLTSRVDRLEGNTKNVE